MHQSIRLRPAAEDRLLGGGNILNFLAQVKALLAKFDVEISRLPEILSLVSTVTSANYHTVEGARVGLSAVVDIADILVLEDQMVKDLNELLSENGPLSLAVWLLNTLTGYKAPEGDADVLPIVSFDDLTPEALTRWLPLILQLLEVLRLFGVKV
jgi:hypothetical protein